MNDENNPHDVAEIVHRHIEAMHKEISEAGKCEQCMVTSMLVSAICSTLANAGKAEGDAILSEAYAAAMQSLLEGDYDTSEPEKKVH